MWDKVYGHQEEKVFLKKFIEAKERPHALLFTGPSGLGKKKLALEFAKTLLCFNANGEDDCASCRSINLLDESYAHPDLIIVGIEPDYTSIRIEQIKELIGKAAFAPVLSANKICLVEDADKMTDAAMNSFLKLLEEPPAGWVIILLAESEDKLLSTILSRVVRLRFKDIPEEDFLKALAEKEITGEKARVLYRMSEGSIGSALALEKENIWEYRTTAFAFLEALPLSAPINYLNGRPWVEKFERVEAILFVKILQILVRDMIFCKLHNTEVLYNYDMEDDLKQLSENWSLRGLKTALAAIEEAYGALTGNSGIRLSMEAVALKIDKAYKE
ncbi:MAG: DNA polymerase III subunit delta' [Phascolarctobacterium sp.]|nr:DNA polymerase III subunit delta' [Phascolarctobacterium sp.]